MSLEEKIIKAILKSHEACNGNSGEASRYLKREYNYGTTPLSIRRYWRKNSLEPKREIKYRGITLSDEEKKYIIHSYDRYEGSPKLASRSMKHSKIIIEGIWRAAGKKIVTARKYK